jgi:hypothetical protein
MLFIDIDDLKREKILDVIVLIQRCAKLVLDIIEELIQGFFLFVYKTLTQV